MSAYTAVIHKEEDMYVAECPEVGTVSQGKTLEEAVSNLKIIDYILISWISYWIIIYFGLSS